MADAKISELTELAQGAIATDDVFAVVDTSATETKKFSWSSLRTDVASYIASLAQTLTNKTIDGNSNTLTVLAGSQLSGATPVANGGTGASTASGARTNLGLVISTDVQAWDAQLDDIAALAVTDGNFIVGNGTNWVAESGATARTSLGLGTAAVVNTDLADLNEATIEAAIDTLANLTSVQGRTVTLADAGANAIFGWDDVASAYENLSQAEVLAIIGDASTTAKGVAELATAAETTSGTDATRAVTPDGLAGSDFGIRLIQVQVVEGATNTAVGDGIGNYRFFVPAQLNGYNLVVAHAAVVTAGTTNTTDIQIHNVTQAADMLTTKITIDSTEKTSYTAATAPVIDTANDDVATGDEIRIDVDAISTTPAKGLSVILGFQLP